MTFSAGVEKVFGPGSKYEVRLDPAYWAERRGQERAESFGWLRTIPCRTGGDWAHLYVHGQDRVGFTGVSTDGRLRGSLLRVPGVQSHQRGDTEFTVTFPTAVFRQVATLVKPKRGVYNPAKFLPQKLPSVCVTPKVGGSTPRTRKATQGAL